MTKARRQFHKTMTGIHLHCIGKLQERLNVEMCIACFPCFIDDQ